jgi:hypothetical protein
MLFDQMARNGQPEASAFPDSFGGGTHLIELIEDRFVLRVWDTHSSIAYGETGKALVAALCNVADTNVPTFRCKLHGVTQKVEQDLGEADAVGVNPKLASMGERQMERFLVRARANGRQNLLNRDKRIEVLRTQHKAAGLDLTQIEDVINQLEQVKGIPQDMFDEAFLLLV